MALTGKSTGADGCGGAFAGIKEGTVGSRLLIYRAAEADSSANGSRDFLHEF